MLKLFTIRGVAWSQGGHKHGRQIMRRESGYKIRMPVKAGTHTIAAAFQKDTVMPEGILFRQRFDNIQSHFEGVGGISVAGPYNVQGPGATPSRDKIFVCHPTAAAEEEACAEKILTGLAHRAYRRPVAADDVPELMALYKQGAETGGFEAGVRLALQKILVSPDFIFRMELDPAGTPPGTRSPGQRCRAGVAPVVLPVEQHSRRRAARRRRAGRAEQSDGSGEPGPSACLPIRARRRW